VTDQPTSPVSPEQQPELKSNPAVAQRAQRISVPWERVVAVLAVAVLGLLIIATIVIVNKPNQTLVQSPATAVAATLAAPTVALAGETISSTATQRPTSTPPPASTETTAPTWVSSLTPAPPVEGDPEVVGTSVQGQSLIVYRLGTGPVKRALIGAIHGGYEWNTVDLMTETLAYLRDHPSLIPANLTLYILPNANPDGYAAGIDRIDGRLNAHKVDLNRNWDYQWQITATHGTNPVSAGTAAFSEPETVALRDFIMNRQIEAVIFYHSAFTAVFQGAGITTSKTAELAQLIAKATGYRYLPEGVAGQITTGDSIDWLTVNGVTAIEVELSTHQTLDWEQNLRGLEAFLNWDLPQTPTPASVASPTPASAESPTSVPPGQTPAEPRIHVVADGETLGGIAYRYGVTLDELRRVNNLKPENDASLQIGRVLQIP
jgi:LysM repeat protein